MSLQEQLLKAGLVSAESVKKQEKETRKRLHESKKDKAVATAEANRKAEEQRRLEQEQSRKRDYDRQLNREREVRKQLKEEKARARQLIASHRLNDAAADIPYNFVDGSFIRFVRVTPQQQIQLAKGRLGIVRGFESQYDFPLVPRETALKLADRFPDSVLLLHPESDLRNPQEETAE